MTARDITMSAAGNAGDGKTYIEDVFSTYLIDSATQSGTAINNGIDLAGKGGMVWFKNRTYTASNYLYDTTRGVNNYLSSNLTSANTSLANSLTSFNSNGFTFGSYWASSGNYASWTFRKAPKFFDVVTATQTTGNTGWLTFNHNLGSVPGMIIVKVTSAADNWFVWHTSQSTKTLWLNLTNAAASTVVCQNVTASSFDFNLANYGSGSGATYVAYLFAHDTTADGLIQCGSFTGASTVNLGWEPQYILVKRSDSTGSWYVIDTMRGWNNTSYTWVRTDSPDSESTTASPLIVPTATGFTTTSAFTGTWIYMAIRRGPMRTPTDGTKVFSPITLTPSGATDVNTGFSSDVLIGTQRDKSQGANTFVIDRMRGSNTSGANGSTKFLATNGTDSEISDFGGIGFDNNTKVVDRFFNYSNYISTPVIYWNFKRAPGFFDVVCYTGTGVARTVNHNLGVAPELMIVKRRNAVESWYVYGAPMGNTIAGILNSNMQPFTSLAAWNNTSPTNSVFTVATENGVNSNGSNYVAYLFASCPGVSKVGSYTGNGTSQTINCGFSAGARFVLIKRTDSTGDWYVWDTARGIVAGTDPHLSLNTTAAEVTTDDTIDPDSTGFIVNQVAATNVNVSGGSYIYLAIA